MHDIHAEKIPYNFRVLQLRIAYNQYLRLIFRLEDEIELLREEKEKGLEPLQDAFELLVEDKEFYQETARRLDAEIFEEMGFMGGSEERSEK